ncbi:dipicolinate synthase subunit B [Oceanobacillus luteolus]|uniref:Dipicolinate synthase subunit B n=1 Tax=Oceanobacillus luteolus TaxID=1274358 RepID=A0ABW4HQV9_9BACI|nr:dipicolinate synthase subunit B [Oceanobacillus luteolus]MCM3738996.1 dipicolinate synthase subunit B [Oceanobacillus luteolus]
MTLSGMKIGFGVTGSHHSHVFVFKELTRLVEEGAEVYPFITDAVKVTDTVHGKAEDKIKKLEDITGNPVVSTIVEAEPFGPKNPLDCMVIAPLTGNSMSKFANAHTDNAVLMAAKSTLRNDSPVVLGVSTNDALGLNGMNLMKLMATKNIFFVPFGQDDPYKKPNSLVADWPSLIDTVEYAVKKQQIQPVLISFG